MKSIKDAGARHSDIVETSGLRFYYEADGRGDPLVLLHAGSLTSEMWQPYMSGFAAHFRVIVPDMPSHGRSSQSKTALSYRQLADEIVMFVQALNLHRPAIVGFSDGGQVALEIGMRYPTLPRSIAMGGVWFKYSDAYRAFVRRALGDENSPDADMECLSRNHPDWARWLDHLYGPGTWKPLLAQLKSMWTKPLNYTESDFASVVAPTLVFVGDRDELVAVEEAAEMRNLLRNAELAVVPAADHSSFFSAKVASFQALILEFLQRSDAGSPYTVRNMLATTESPSNTPK